MAKVEVDLRAVQRAVGVSAQEVRRMPGRFLAAANRGAEREQQTKTYKNRTTNLVKGTTAALIDGGESFAVTLSMGEHYASHVIRLGFSNFHQIAGVQVTGDIARVVALMGTKLSKL